MVVSRRPASRNREPAAVFGCGGCAARGAGEGMYQLACCYAAGRLTARSLRQARLWCRRAVEAHPDAPVDAQARALLDELERADG